MSELQVFLFEEDGVWIAQSLEIDYCTQGDSEGDARAWFERGMRASIEANLEHFGHLRGLLKTTDGFREVAAKLEAAQVLSQRPAAFACDSEGWPFEGIVYKVISVPEKALGIEVAS